MSIKSQKEQRQKAYDKWCKTHPQHADATKRFIYNEAKQKDDYGIIMEVLKSKDSLSYIANHSKYLLDDELNDLKFMLQEKLGKKTFKKLRKIFAL